MKGTECAHTCRVAETGRDEGVGTSVFLDSRSTEEYFVNVSVS